MSRRESVGRLLEISRNRDLGVDDVVAIQMAVRILCKRIFEKERCLKRRRAAPGAAAAPGGTGCQPVGGGE